MARRESRIGVPLLGWVRHHGRGGAICCVWGPILRPFIWASRSRKGCWRMSTNSIAQAALTNDWLKAQGVPSLQEAWIAYHYPPALPRSADPGDRNHPGTAVSVRSLVRRPNPYAGWGPVANHHRLPDWAFFGIC